MLAQEIAGLIPVRGLLLMGTCRSAAGVSFGLRQLAPLMKIVPMPDHGAHVLAWPLALKFGVTRPAHRQLLAALIDDADPRFLRWASQVAAAWPGIKEPGIKEPGIKEPGTKALSLPLFQIHGSRDHLMPVERSGAETIIHGAGHLLALTHAPQVATWMLHALTATD
jgi:pimeloyl-ACP methyl ester carboxylesterase